MIKLWQRFKEWLVIRQSAKFAKELKRKGYRNIITINKSILDLTNQNKVLNFLI